MNLKRLLSIFVLVVILISGVWLLGQPGELAPESLTRLQALSHETTGGQTNTHGVGELGDQTPEIIIHDPVPGSAIALSDLPVEEDNGDSLYQRWLNGEIDLEEENFLSPDQEAELRRIFRDKGKNEAIQVPTQALDNILLEKTFPGPDIRECCSTTTQGTVPPDPELAVGTNHVIAVINIAFEIYDKDGIVLQQNTTFSSLFSGVSGCNTLAQLFDPNVLYDESADRFFLGIASESGNYCAAVSATADPTGTWYRYRFSTASSGGFFDYPHAGIGLDAIYMGGNIFVCSNGCPYREARVWAFNKSAMYANAPTSVVERAVPGGQTRDTPQPANLHGFAQGTWPTSGPHYFIVDENFNGSTYGVFAWTNPFGSNNFGSTGTFNLTAATGVSPVFPFTTAQQLGSSKQLRTNDWRVQDNEYRNGFLWSTNTISCNPGGGVVTCVRWAQVNPTNATIVQAGVLGSPNEYRYFSDLAVNHCSDMAMGYTKSSSSSYPGIWVAGREGNDPNNTIQGETILKAGERSYDAFDNPPLRWGDYTGFTSDPNGRDLWYIGQFSKNVSHPSANWGTHIGCYTVPSCEVPNTKAPPVTGTTPSEPPEGFDQFSYLPFLSNDPVIPIPSVPCSPP